jgi:hypothetical protein
MSQEDVNTRRSWYGYCIKPSLAKLKDVKSFGLQQSEMKLIKEIVEENYPQSLDDESAFEFLKLLKNSSLFELDESWKWFRVKNDDFWGKVLTQILKIREEYLLKLMLENKETMISSAVLCHYNKYIIDDDFAKAITRF